MFLRRFLSTSQPADEPGLAATSAGDAETQTVRRIVRSLEALPAGEARYLAGFAYVLSRAAHADLHVDERETTEMERIVVEHGGLTEAQAIVVVEIAKTQARLHGETEDFLVTREFAASATEAQRLALLRCCYLVGAAADGISAAESGVISQIANELGFDSLTAGRVRAEFADRISALRTIRRPEGG